MVGAKVEQKDEGVVPLPTKWTKPKPTMPPSMGAAASTSSPSHPKPTMPPSIMVGAKVEEKDEGVVPLPTKWTKPKPTMPPSIMVGKKQELAAAAKTLAAASTPTDGDDGSPTNTSSWGGG